MRRVPLPAPSAAAALLLLVLAHSAAAQVKVGAGSYATAAPGAVPGGSLWFSADNRQHPVTAQWWATLATSAFSGEMYAHPACYKAVAQGLEIGYPGAPSVSGDGFYSRYAADLTVGIEGLAAAAAEVAGYSHFSVTARWTGGGRILEALIAHGLPFSYFKVTGGRAAVTAAAAPYYNENGTLGVTVGGKSYGIYAPTGSVWTGTGTLVSALAGKDYLSVAVLPDDRVETLLHFRKYAYSHVRRTVVSWQYQEATAMLLSTYSVETEAKEGSETGTLFALLRHHWLETVSPLTAYGYAGARGEMKVAAGPSFTTAMRFNGILPAMPDAGRDLDALKSHIAGEAAGSGDGDSYGAGKQLGRLAALVQLADFAGHAAKRDEFVAALKARLQEWLTAGGPRQVYYHRPWGSLIAYPGAYGSNTRLSDHHFHFGYFIQAAAVVAQRDKEWAKPGNWGGMVELLIREVNAWEEADPLFGRFRYFDPYEGHGWADGTGFPERGNNQESSSESMNFNAAVIQWGVNTGNRAIRDLGLFMYVNEARAVEQYWWDVDGRVFPPAYPHHAVGMVWGNGGAYGTWFSARPSAIHGINILPITAGHLYLGRNPDHVARNYAEGSEGAEGAWQDLFLQYLAFADADRAVAAYGDGVAPEAGSSRAYAYHHLQSLKAAGRLNTSIGADVPSFAVFDKAGTRTYTAFNPGADAITVTFTDGFALGAPAGAQVSATGPVRPVSAAMGMRALPRASRRAWTEFRTGRQGPAGVVARGLPGLRIHDLLGRELGRARGEDAPSLFPERGGPAAGAPPVPPAAP